MDRLRCWRLRPCDHLGDWSAGRPGCCAVWGYRTPWGALRGARGLHRSRHRKTDPMPAWVAEVSEAITARRAEGITVIPLTDETAELFRGKGTLED
jgi:hypothetical protein